MSAPAKAFFGIDVIPGSEADEEPAVRVHRLRHRVTAQPALSEVEGFLVIPLRSSWE